MRERRMGILLCLMALAGARLFAQAGARTEAISFRLNAGFEPPFQTTPALFTNVAFYADLNATLPINGLRPLFMEADLSGSALVLNADNTVGLMALDLGVGALWEPLPPLQLRAYAAGGFYAGFLTVEARDEATGNLYEDQSGMGPFVRAGLNVDLFISPLWSLGLNATYAWYIGLVQTLRFGAGVSLNLEGLSKNVKLSPAEMEPVFPALAKHYNGNGMGTAEIWNNERFTISKVSVSLRIPGLMDQAVECGQFEALKPGERRTVVLKPVLGAEALTHASDNETTAVIGLEYRMNGRTVRQERSAPLKVFSRNAMTWDDDRKTAAFINSRDSDILAFAKEISGLVQDQKLSAVNMNLRVAAAVHDTLGEYHVSYVRDPNTPAYVDASANASIVDFLQYPNQTLKFKGGDCDDLSILNASLLESIGVPTALITVPGHVFLAFDSGIPPSELKKTFGSDADFVVKDGRAWVPLEITLVNASFKEAWRKGAEEWREAFAAGQAAFYTVAEGWKTWDCTGSPSDVGAVAPLDVAASRKRFSAEMDEFIAVQLAELSAPLLEELGRDPDNPKINNRLGILFAGYGQVDRAEACFQQAQRAGSYTPALINLASLRLLQNKVTDAIALFEDALARSPDNRSAIAGLSQAYKKAGEQRKVDSYLASLKKVDPEAGAYLAYLGSGSTGGRAAGGEELPVVYWDAEE
jgi:hypothetical protein